MNAINYALSVIKQTIPKEILNQAFLPSIEYTTRIPVNVETRIKDLVIRAIVMEDINIIGGSHITVPLDGLPQEVIELNAIIVRVPKERTQGRSILTVLSVAFGGAAMAGLMNAPMTDGGDLANATSQMANAISAIPYMSEAQATLVAENTVMIQGMGQISGSLYLRCEVENDINLNNIHRRSFKDFADLCVLAVKRYIYNLLIVEMDIGYLNGGAQLGKLRDIVEEYSDADEKYGEMLKTTWAVVSKLNDAETAERMVRWTTGGCY